MSVDRYGRVVYRGVRVAKLLFQVLAVASVLIEVLAWLDDGSCQKQITVLNDDEKKIYIRNFPCFFPKTRKRPGVCII